MEPKRWGVAEQAMTDHAELRCHSFCSLLDGASSPEALPDGAAECNVFFDEGISQEGDVQDVATALGLVQKKGSHYSYGELQMGQGRDTAVEFLREHIEVMTELVEPIRSSSAQLQTLPVSGNGAG